MYWTYLDDEALTHDEYISSNHKRFSEIEHKFYEDYFRKRLDITNENYTKQRHYERVQTMNEYRRNERFCPEEQILQIGNKDNHVDTKLLFEIMQEQLEWEQKTFPNCVVLDAALHMDEATPHFHIRKVWTAWDDKNSCYEVSQIHALEQMKIERPDITKKRDKNNNPKQTYTKMCREHLEELCISKGITLENDRLEMSRTGLDLLEYKRQQEEKKLEIIKEEYKELESLLQVDEFQLNEIKKLLSDALVA